jgi:uncharacterized Zn-binding protein involved in type VI secretion
MPPGQIINASAVVQCVHGGMVTLIPKQPKVLIGGSPALTLGDIMGSPILCPVPPSPGSKPCTAVVADPMMWASSKVLIGGKPALVQAPAPSGTTDGVPPVPMAGLMCTFAGQTVVMAMG